MTLTSARCLILACGNTLREDDGVGPWLAARAEERFRNQPAVRVLSRHQWTPELAEEIAPAESVLFLDCSTSTAPGLIGMATVEPSVELPRLLTHHLGAPDLLALARDLYGSLPRNAMLLTVGAGSLQLREGFSKAVSAALPQAVSRIETTVLNWLVTP